MNKGSIQPRLLTIKYHNVLVRVKYYNHHGEEMNCASIDKP